MSDIIDKMESILNELIGTAKQLLRASTEAASKETVEPLQEKQEELVQSLVELDASCPPSPEGTSDLRSDPKWNSIQEKLEEFQQLNEKFIENMQMRQSLIHFDIKELKKRRRQLSQLKAVYGSKKSVRDQTRINTVS